MQPIKLARFGFTTTFPLHLAVQRLGHSVLSRPCKPQGRTRPWCPSCALLFIKPLFLPAGFALAPIPGCATAAGSWRTSPPMRRTAGRDSPFHPASSPYVPKEEMSFFSGLGQVRAIFKQYHAAWLMRLAFGCEHGTRSHAMKWT